MSTRHARVADKELNEKHTKILCELLQQPENKTCADCRKKDPRWASWNLGIFVCIRCSGTHRSLGTHISKVKSVDLDTWTPDQIQNMIEWGNKKANIYWEANLDDRKPSDYSIDVWIRAKYVDKKWVRRTETVDSEIKSDDEKEGTQSEINANSNDDKQKAYTTHDYNVAYQKLASLVKEKKEEDIINSMDEVKDTRSTYKSEDLQTITPKNDFKLDMTSFQQQLSGLTMGRPSSGLIPQAPAGSNSSWTNFLIDQQKGTSKYRNDSLLNEPSTEKPLISYEALASLRRSR